MDGGVGLLVGAISDVLNEPRFAIERVARAQARVRQEYSLENRMLKLADMYREIVSTMGKERISI